MYIHVIMDNTSVPSNLVCYPFVFYLFYFTKIYLSDRGWYKFYASLPSNWSYTSEASTDGHHKPLRTISRFCD